MTSIPDSVECPECGQSFDPKVQGGWCTNTDCGGYKWEPDEDDSAGEDSDSVDGGSDPGGGGSDSDSVVCPNCDERVPDKQYCKECGQEMDPGGEATPTTPTCPQCDEEVEEGWAACINCGADLSDTGSDTTDTDTGDSEDAEPDATTSAGTESSPSRVIFEVGGSEIRIEDGDVFGTKIRKAHVQAGGDEEESRYVSRDHAMMEHEGSDFYIVNKHRNGLEVNGEEVPVDDREKLSEGDQITFAGVVTATVGFE